MYTYYFEKLDVFKNIRDLINSIYQQTNQFPNNEDFILMSQIRRSAVSVMANVVEGNSRMTNKDQANFSTIAYSSLMELLSLIIISYDQNYIKDDVYKTVREKIDHISNQLISLRRAQLNK